MGVLFDVGDGIYELVLIFGWMMGGSGEKGKFRESSAIRHRIVMERIFSADVSLETAREAAIAVNNARIQAISSIQEDYMRQKSIPKFHVDSTAYTGASS